MTKDEGGCRPARLFFCAAAFNRQPWPQQQGWMLLSVTHLSRSLASFSCLCTFCILSECVMRHWVNCVTPQKLFSSWSRRYVGRQCYLEKQDVRGNPVGLYATRLGPPQVRTFYNNYNSNDNNIHFNLYKQSHSITYKYTSSNVHLASLFGHS